MRPEIIELSKTKFLVAHECDHAAVKIVASKEAGEFYTILGRFPSKRAAKDYVEFLDDDLAKVMKISQ